VIHKGLWDRIRDLEAIVEVQQASMELLTLRGDMLATQVENLIATTTMAHAHVENLIDRVADLEGTPRTKRAWEGRHGGLPEATATDTPVSPSPDSDKNPAGW
jgi:hypothetical protein